MKKLLIYGAGAIGRGYLPRVFKQDSFEYYFVETNAVIRDKLNENKGYTSYMTVDNRYDVEYINIQTCFAPGEEVEMIEKVDAVLVAVGPRNFVNLYSTFTGSKVPVICFENDSSLPIQMRKATGNQNIFFAVPDVITSFTAPQELLDKDPLSIITENGVCFIDEKAKPLGGDCSYVSEEELQKQWLAKLYIHNTPHCITAYFGSLIGATYLHQSMEHSGIATVIRGVMNEMESMLSKRNNIDADFLKFYSGKELQRFSNELLFDPIARVAREPFRKLAPNERLIGAAQLCLSSGVIPENLFKGIMTAFCFENDNDPDFHIKHLMNALTPGDFLTIIIRLRRSEVLFEMLMKRWDSNINFINQIKSYVQ